MHAAVVLTIVMKKRRCATPTAQRVRKTQKVLIASSAKNGADARILIAAWTTVALFVRVVRNELRVQAL
jgi:hypothetical protein